STRNRGASAGDHCAPWRRGTRAEALNEVRKPLGECRLSQPARTWPAILDPSASGANSMKYGLISLLPLQAARILGLMRTVEAVRLDEDSRPAWVLLARGRGFTRIL